jgi:hypothetical protein
MADVSAILSWLASFLGGPVISGLINAYKAKLDAGNTQGRIAADLAAKELDVQAREIEAQKAIRIAEIGKWYEPDKIMGYIAAAYFAKIVVWDTMLGLGTTPKLYGWADATATLIIGAYFGKRTFENVARIIKR